MDGALFRDMVGLNIEKYRPKITEIFDRHLGNGYVLFLFGSYAKGNADRLSDIDLAVYRHKPISSKDIMCIKEDIETNLGILREIDLINLTDSTIDSKIIDSIYQEGVLWVGEINSKEFLNDLKRH